MPIASIELCIIVFIKSYCILFPKGNKRLFIADLKRMFANCRAYNAPDTEYYNCANVLEKYVMTKMRDHGLLEK